MEGEEDYHPPAVCPKCGRTTKFGGVRVPAGPEVDTPRGPPWEILAIACSIN